MEDKLTRFARDWTLVGLSSKRSLHKTATLGRMLHAILQGMVKEFGQDAVDVIASSCYLVGLEEGANLAEKIETGRRGTARCLRAVETAALLNSVATDIASDEHGAILAADRCLYGDLPKVIPGMAEVVCTSYTLGLIEAVSNNVDIKFPKLMCRGDDECEVMIILK